MCKLQFLQAAARATPLTRHAKTSLQDTGYVLQTDQIPAELRSDLGGLAIGIDAVHSVLRHVAKQIRKFKITLTPADAEFAVRQLVTEYKSLDTFGNGGVDSAVVSLAYCFVKHVRFCRATFLPTGIVINLQVYHDAFFGAFKAKRDMINNKKHGHTD